MDLINSINNYFQSIELNVSNLLGINIKYLSSFINSIGIIISAIIVIIVIVLCLMTYVNSVQYNPFLDNYSENSLYKSKISSIASFLIVFASIWLLFSIVYFFYFL